MRDAVQRRKILTMLLTGLVLVALWWAQQQVSAPDSSGSTSTSQSTRTSDRATDPDSGLPIIQVADLPPEAAETLSTIDAGGPYPYDEDDGTFGNFEGILPDQDRGYYREYTVDTPGLDHRGARRIVTGSSDEFYWTADHYSSFSRIAR